MLDFMLEIFSSVLQMNMRDHHEIPFALPLVMGSFAGFTIGFIILQFIGNEQKQARAKIADRNQNQDENLS